MIPGIKKYQNYLLTIIGIATLSIATSCSDIDRTRPNVVLILADDLGYGDIKALNYYAKTSTPNIDRLIKEGINMRDAHSPASVCTPTRYSLLTGRFAWRSELQSGVLWGYSPSLIEDGRATIASMFQDYGYRTGGFGKWHLGLGSADSTDYNERLSPGPNDFGFDYYYGIPASLDMDPYVYFENDRAVQAPTDTIEASRRARSGGKGFWRAGPISPDFRHEEVLGRTVDKAVEFIESATTDEPFFAYVPLPAPHTPWLPTGEFKGSSGAGKYGDFVNMMDSGVGRILDAISRIDAEKNTLIIFTSDNGADWLPSEIEKFDHEANLGLRGRKADIYEAGHRVPLIAKWPNQIWANSQSDEPVMLTDIFATLAEILGHEFAVDAAEDSFSILDALIGRPHSQPIRPHIISHSLDGTFAVRHDFWKLIEGLGSGGFTEPAHIDPTENGPTGQLFDIYLDRKETVDHFSDESRRVEDLQRQLDTARDDGRTRHPK